MFSNRTVDLTFVVEKLFQNSKRLKTPFLKLLKTKIFVFRPILFKTQLSEKLELEIEFFCAFVCMCVSPSKRNL